MVLKFGLSLSKLIVWKIKGKTQIVPLTDPRHSEFRILQLGKKRQLLLTLSPFFMSGTEEVEWDMAWGNWGLSSGPQTAARRPQKCTIVRGSSSNECFGLQETVFIILRYCDVTRGKKMLWSEWCCNGILFSNRATSSFHQILAKKWITGKTKKVSELRNRKSLKYQNGYIIIDSSWII